MRSLDDCYGSPVWHNRGLRSRRRLRRARTSRRAADRRCVYQSTTVIVGAVVIRIVEGQSGEQPLVDPVIGADRHRRKLGFVTILEPIVTVTERIRARRQKYARTRAQAEYNIRAGAPAGGS